MNAKRVFWSALALVVFFACGYAGSMYLGNGVSVCVENDREVTANVAVRDAYSGHKIVELHQVMSFSSRCRKTRRAAIRGRVTVTVDATGYEAVEPPALRNLIVTGRKPLRIRIGPDGVTPFAHSHRIYSGR